VPYFLLSLMYESCVHVIRRSWDLVMHPSGHAAVLDIDTIFLNLLQLCWETNNLGKTCIVLSIRDLIMIDLYVRKLALYMISFEQRSHPR
jgi:hypothetical protein